MARSGMVGTVVKILGAVVVLAVIWVVAKPYLPGLKDKVNEAVEEIQEQVADQAQEETPSEPTTGTVSDVLGPYSLQLAGGDQVVLFGLMSVGNVPPEKQEEALEFLSGNLINEKVRLEYDEGNQFVGRRDAAGRLLAYVFRERDNLDVNAEMVRQGYAQIDSFFNRKDEFAGYLQEAQQAGLGFWERAEEPELAPQQPEEEVVKVDPVFFLIKGDEERFHALGCRLMGRGARRKLRGSDGIKESEAREKGMKFCVVCGIDIGNVVYVDGRYFHRRNCERLTEEGYASRRGFARQRKVNPCDHCF